MTRNALIVGVVLGIGMSVSAKADIINVPGDQLTIQDGIDAAVNGDEVVVSAGTYMELIDYGGRTITVRSVDGSGATTIDGGGSGTVVTVSATGPGTTLQGFTITGASLSGLRADNEANLNIDDCVFYNNVSTQGGDIPEGGGIRAEFCNGLTLTGCRFEQNSSSRGAGIWAGNSMLTLVECEFLSNVAALEGGGLYLQGAHVDMTDCVFDANSALGGRWGAAIHRDAGAVGTDTWSGCTFTANSTDSVGQTAAVVVTEGRVEFVNCVFDNNPAGSVIYTPSPGFPPTRVEGCSFTGNMKGILNVSTGGEYPIELTDCSFVSNAGTAFQSSSGAIVTRCTFTQNVSPSGAGGISGSATITDSTFCDNQPVDIIGGVTLTNVSSCDLVPSGACCVAAICIVSTEAECVAAGGVYQGDDVACLDAMCPGPPAVGACCVNDLCLLSTEANCTSLSGAYQGDGSDCASIECPVLGGCCISGACVQVSPEECFVAGGSFAGISTECVSVDCPVVCVGDLVVDGEVGFADLLIILASWGPCPG